MCSSPTSVFSSGPPARLFYPPSCVGWPGHLVLLALASLRCSLCSSPRRYTRFISVDFIQDIITALRQLIGGGLDGQSSALPVSTQLQCAITALQMLQQDSLMSRAINIDLKVSLNQRAHRRSLLMTRAVNRNSTRGCTSCCHPFLATRSNRLSLSSPLCTASLLCPRTRSR